MKKKWVAYNHRDELTRAIEQIEVLQTVVRAAEALQGRLAHHFQGTYDWKEQDDLRTALERARLWDDSRNP